MSNYLVFQIAIFILDDHYIKLNRTEHQISDKV